MEKKDRIVFMTRELFRQYSSEAVSRMMNTAKEESTSPMTGFIVGSTAMIALGKLENIIFGEEEPETDHNTETSIF